MLLALPQGKAWGLLWALLWALLLVLLLVLLSSISPALAPDTVGRQYTAQPFRRQDALGQDKAHFLTYTFLFPAFPPFFRTKETEATQGDCRIIRTRRRCQIWCCCFLSGSNYCSSGTLCARSGQTLGRHWAHLCFNTSCAESQVTSSPQNYQLPNPIQLPQYGVEPLRWPTALAHCAGSPLVVPFRSAIFLGYSLRSISRQHHTAIIPAAWLLPLGLLGPLRRRLNPCHTFFSRLSPRSSHFGKKNKARAPGVC